MNVLVDTTAWSLVLRRTRGGLNAEERIVAADLQELIEEGRARIIGPIRQEILSGIRDRQQFEQVRLLLCAFPDTTIESSDYETAARFYNDCRAAGIAGSQTDLLICAIAAREGWPVFTRDRDFRAYARIVPVALYSPRAA